MKTTFWTAVVLIVVWQGFGCASTQVKESQFKNSVKQGDGELAYLICENKVPEGETKPKKVCWEASEGESPKANQEDMVLYCIERDGKQVCGKQEGIQCEYRAETGTRIPKLRCVDVEDAKARSFRDQRELDRTLMQSQ